MITNHSQNLNEKNTNNKVNRWGLELATYNITFEWISVAKNKAADYLSCLVEVPQTTAAPFNVLSVSNTDGPIFNTRNQTQQCLASNTTTAQLSITPEVSPAPNPTPKSLTADRLEALLQMQKTDLFASGCLNAYPMGKHHNMKQTSSFMSKDCYINTSWIQVRSCLL